MNFVKSFVRQTINSAREISSMSPKRREVMGNASAMLAKSYMTDIFRAADFITAITKNPSPEEVIKVLLPNTSKAVNHITDMLNDVDMNEQKKAAQDAATATAAAQAPVPPPMSPATPYEFKINPKVWAPHGQSTNG